MNAADPTIRTPRSNQAVRPCPRCEAPLNHADRFCGECGLPVSLEPETAGRPAEARVASDIGIVDVMSLAIITVGAFIVTAVFIAFWEQRAGRALPWPVDNPPRGGGVAAGTLLLLGTAYLLLLRRRQRRRH